MLFSPDLCEKILEGAKTVTRRPCQPDVACRYIAGRSYAVQPGRGKKAVARIAVTSVSRERLCDMHLEDVILEGFGSHDEFANKWATLYGKSNWLDLVWRIEFVLVTEEVVLGG